uniref:Variable lymphocyte receptor, putative n=2 Tax=Schistosoma mansoni TaxID=6183 RepID=G4LVT7_SCHMA
MNMDYLQNSFLKSYFHFLQYILLIIIIVSNIRLSSTMDTTICPQQCICSSKRMNCELPGLKYLPIPPMLQLEYLLIQNQTFINTHLGSNELSIYRSIEFGGKIQLKSLHIRYCNIESLGRNTFQTIGSQLRLLDLTGNPLIEIADYAFNGLDQLTLIMDEIKLPSFHENTFNGLTRMKSLIMRNSNLRELPYKSLEQLTSVSRLGQLILKGNQLRRLDMKYDVIFKELQNFEINDNPWHCDCQLNWLIKRYRSIHKHNWNETIENSWDREDNQPKCLTPHSLAGHKFSDLITDLSEAYNSVTSTWQKSNPPFILYCPPPQLERLDVDLTNLHQMKSKYSKDSVIENSNEKSIISNDQHSSVRLTCSMKGSIDLSIMWYYHNNNNNTMTSVNVSNNHIIHKYPKDRQISYINNEKDVWSIKTNEIIKVESELEVIQQHQIDMYSCIGIDVIGNVTATVRLQWPLIQLTKLSEIDNQLSILKVSSNDSKSNYLNNWSTTSLSYSNSVLHMKQFSLGELIAATAGTFLSTVLLFFIIYQTLHRRLSPCDKRKLYRPHKTDNGILEVPGISPGGISSSNTLCSVSRPTIITTTTTPNNNNNSNSSNSSVETNLLQNSITNCPTSQINSESISLATNLINAQQFLNGLSGFSQATLPVNIQQQTIQTELGRCIRPAPSSTIGDGSLNSMSYEPISYSDTNNVTYDVPWIVNTNNNDNNINNHKMVNVNQRISNEQCVPLLYNGLPANIPNHIESNPNNLIHTGLFIPPPPSIPQPSLPNSCTNSTLSLKAVTVQPNFQGNLLFLQSGCYPQVMNSVTTNSQLSQGSSGLTNYLNYHS